MSDCLLRRVREASERWYRPLSGGLELLYACVYQLTAHGHVLEGRRVWLVGARRLYTGGRIDRSWHVKASAVIHISGGLQSKDEYTVSLVRRAASGSVLPDVLDLGSCGGARRSGARRSDWPAG